MTEGTKEETKVIYIRLTLKEHEEVTRQADRLGISLSAFIRLLIKQWDDGIEFRQREKGEKSGSQAAASSHDRS